MGGGKYTMAAEDDIVYFFKTGGRDDNDAVNKLREGVLKLCLAPPPIYLEGTHGVSWKMVSDGWKAVLSKIGEEAGIHCAQIETNARGGRSFNYDMDVHYTTASQTLYKKLEFKYGASSIEKLPQFLSLQARFPFFPVQYDSYYYDNYLAAYVALDNGITEPIPPKDIYMNMVTRVSDAGPFFTQLKEREEVNKKQKAAIVNASITQYLITYSADIDLELLGQKLKESQENKVYVLWNNESFHLDQINLEDMALEYAGIKNGNVLLIKSGANTFEMLLRWRNHKGILNPAWQISMKRY